MHPHVTVMRSIWTTRTFVCGTSDTNGKTLLARDLRNLSWSELWNTPRSLYVRPLRSSLVPAHAAPMYYVVEISRWLRVELFRSYVVNYRQFNSTVNNTSPQSHQCGFYERHADFATSNTTYGESALISSAN